jgi:hypothetical protein
MKLIDGSELSNIEQRLDELANEPFQPPLAQLLRDANTLLEQVHELHLRRAQLRQAMLDLIT